MNRQTYVPSLLLLESLAIADGQTFYVQVAEAGAGWLADGQSVSSAGRLDSIEYHYIRKQTLYCSSN
jgi:hypothetical protein